MKRGANSPGRLRQLQIGSLFVGIAAAAGCAVGAYSNPAHFFPAYLVGYLYWLGLSLGCLAIVMLHNLTGGGWGTEIRQFLEEGFILIPLMGVLFVPLLLGMPNLYSWSRAEVVEADVILQRKARYLNVEAFQWRAAAYFAIWIILALTFYRRRARPGQDDAAARRPRALLSGPGLILWALTVTFSSIDWVMSLEPHWSSSMYGALFMGAQGVAGLSFGIVILILMRNVAGLTTSLTAARLGDLANLLLAFVLFWSYVSFMQYLIIWSGNLPEESPWYLNRASGGWEWLALLLIGFHFLVPFLLLLSSATKRNPSRLLAVAVLLLGMRLIDLFWLVLPALWPGQFHAHWLDVLAPIAVGGIWISAFLWRLSVRAATLQTPEIAGSANP